ncbi:hypothetical protein AYI70_g8814 [Smittium culicis]|uniref:Uncharacterized protein n=1 Tax=Smittium culicis TaxID=133412 RepID=A0A1R1XE69_9FUNG|nr:hypothetical protein AYI70_g8814 [Smittium culicis]
MEIFSSTVPLIRTGSVILSDSIVSVTVDSTSGDSMTLSLAFFSDEFALFVIFSSEVVTFLLNSFFLPIISCSQTSSGPLPCSNCKLPYILYRRC